MINLTVVMYHYVRELKESAFPAIKGLELSDFIGQLGFLQKKHTIVGMDAVLDSIERRTRLPENAALLTFDDGYAEHFTTVFPVLEAEGVHGAFYPSAAAVQERRVLDVNKVHLILASVADKEALMRELLSLLDEFHEEYRLESNETYIARYAVANRFDPPEVIFFKRMLQKVLDEDLRAKIVDRLFRQLVGVDEAALSDEFYMSAKQLRVMIERGMHVGSHGYSHRWLSSLRPDQQEEEIVKSLRFLEGLGADVSRWTMCYPYGDYDATTLRLVRQHGCQAGFTTEVRVADIEVDDRLALPRLDTNDLPKRWTASGVPSIDSAEEQ